MREFVLINRTAAAPCNFDPLFQETPFQLRLAFLCGCTVKAPAAMVKRIFPTENLFGRLRGHLKYFMDGPAQPEQR